MVNEKADALVEARAVVERRRVALEAEKRAGVPFYARNEEDRRLSAERRDAHLALVDAAERLLLALCDERAAPDARKFDALRVGLANLCPVTATPRTIGNSLKKFRDRIIDGLVFDEGKPDRNGVMRWIVRPAGSSGSAETSQYSFHKGREGEKRDTHTHIETTGGETPQNPLDPAPSQSGRSAAAPRAVEPERSLSPTGTETGYLT